MSASTSVPLLVSTREHQKLRARVGQPQQIDLFGDERQSALVAAPAWQELPVETQAALTNLMTDLPRIAKTRVKIRLLDCQPPRRVIDHLNKRLESFPGYDLCVRRHLNLRESQGRRLAVPKRSRRRHPLSRVGW